MSQTERPQVAYFCMEFGLAAELPVYAGGLGILAGDAMKSAGDLRLPVTGIGLFWDEGYCRQHVRPDGHVEDRYVPTARDALEPLDVEFSVPVAGRQIPCRAFRVTRHLSGTLYLIEPAAASDRWITRRLYGGGLEDRIAQELLLGVGGVRLLRALGRSPDVYHFNEGHAVFAGLELLGEGRAAGLSFEDALARVRRHVVFTTHTPVLAGNEAHDLDLLHRMGADLGHTREELISLGGSPFNMTVAGLRLSRRANAVAELHGETARAMWRAVDRAAPIISVTNGVHVGTWQDARVRAAVVADKPPERRRAALWRAHQELKAELCAALAAETGADLRQDGLLVGFARRAATYKRADLVFGDTARLAGLFERGLQLVFAGKAHPADGDGKAVIARIREATHRFPGQVVYVENYDMRLGALLTRGCDVWLNNPRRPKEASGTSGMKAAMNGVLNLSVLDGWWPEGCRHGETGWSIGDSDNSTVDLSPAEIESIDARDRESLYRVLADEVMPRYQNDREAWIAMMEESVAMASWRFSSDRMVEDYFERLYAPD
ncbi:MAG TPA: alpha-glucan family phosphorylase [Kofleriaceae bacterium]